MGVKRKQIINKILSALLVEDDIFCLRVQSAYLKELSYRVEMVRNAESAMRKVKKSFYDLILLDLGLPDRRGEEVIIAARRSPCNQKTPIIIVTAHANSALQKYCLFLGATRVFIKPFSQSSLKEAIQSGHVTY